MIPFSLFKEKRSAYKVRVGYRSTLERAKKSLIFLLVIILAHIISFYTFEPVSILDSIWVTMISITTIGYGDISATTVAGKISTIVLICLFGIWLFANFVAVIVDLIQQRSKLKIIGKWRWKLNNPIVIIGSPKNNAESFFKNLLVQIRSTKDLREKDILLVTNQFPEGLSESLTDLGAVLLAKKSDDKSLYKDKNVLEADIIYLIAKEESNGISNSITFNALSLLKESGIEAKIIAETTKECDRERFLSYGATSVIRPIRAYPEMVVRAMINEQNVLFIENMFSSQGDEPVVYPISFKGKWLDVVIGCVSLNAGTPVGYITQENKLVCNPNGTDYVELIGLQILVKDDCIKNHLSVVELLNDMGSK